MFLWNSDSGLATRAETLPTPLVRSPQNLTFFSKNKQKKQVPGCVKFSVKSLKSRLRTLDANQRPEEPAGCLERGERRGEFKVLRLLLCLRRSEPTCPPSCSEERFRLPVRGVSLSQEQGLGGPPAFLPGSHRPGLGASGRTLHRACPTGHTTRPRMVPSSGPTGTAHSEASAHLGERDPADFSASDRGTVGHMGQDTSTECISTGLCRQNPHLFFKN